MSAANTRSGTKLTTAERMRTPMPGGSLAGRTDMANDGSKQIAPVATRHPANLPAAPVRRGRTDLRRGRADLRRGRADLRRGRADRRRLAAPSQRLGRRLAEWRLAQ